MVERIEDLKVDQELDLKGEVCPYTFVRSKLALEDSVANEVFIPQKRYSPHVRPLNCFAAPTEWLMCCYHRIIFCSHPAGF